MSYTVSDWAREKLQVRVRYPRPDGSWGECWMPVDLGDALPTALFAQRTWEGSESADFEAMAAHGFAEITDE